MKIVGIGRLTSDQECEITYLYDHGRQVLCQFTS